MNEPVELHPKLNPLDPTSPGAWKWHWAGSAAIEQEEWLIEGLLPKRSYTGLFGKRGSGKSFFAFDLAMCAGYGIPFFGRDTERFGTIYAIGEKKGRHAKREAAWLQSRRITEASAVMVRNGCPDLLDEEEVSSFISDTNSTKGRFDGLRAPLRLIVMDTLARAVQGRNVSDQEVAGKATVAIQRIIDETGCTVLTVAHMAKADGVTTQKGAGEWEDAADTLIRIERVGGEHGPVRKATVAKQSDDADGASVYYELDVVEVGTSLKGRSITSCVLREVDPPEGEESGTKGLVPRLSADAELVVRALTLAKEAGQAVPVPFCPGVAPGTIGLRYDDLRTSVYRLGLQQASEPDAVAPEKERKQWGERRRKAFQRAVDGTRKAGKTREWEGFIWLV